MHFLLIVFILAQRFPSNILSKNTAPTFRDGKYEARRYEVKNIPEDTPVGTSILRVNVLDPDSGKDGDLQYSVTDEMFKIRRINRNEADIIINKRLDFDWTCKRIPHRYCEYEFKAIVQDRGSPPLSHGVKVCVLLVNTNDEAPYFNEKIMRISYLYGTGWYVYTVRANDVDGDHVDVYFNKKGQTDHGPFKIDPGAHVISKVGKLDPSISVYNITLVAVDDGRCCKTGGENIGYGTLIITITGRNNFMPTFDLCKSYNPSIEENSPIGTFVIQVSAIDMDPGNPEIVYELGDSLTKQRWVKIDSKTGVISVSENIDLEGAPGQSFMVTAYAKNVGIPGLCYFQVKVTDANDHYPKFTKNGAKKTIGRDWNGAQIYQVKATDIDRDANGYVKYYIMSPFSDYFTVNPFGIVIYKKMLPTFYSKKTISVVIVATDQGRPMRTNSFTLTLDIQQATDPGSRRIEQSVSRGSERCTRFSTGDRAMALYAALLLMNTVKSSWLLIS